MGNNIDNCIDIVVYYPLYFNRIENITPEFCMKLVKKDPTMLKYIPAELQTEDVCMEAIKKEPYIITYITSQNILDKILHYILNNDVSDLIYFNEEQISKLISNDTWKFIIKKVPSMIYFSPMTKELIKLALNEDPWSMHYIPKEYQTEDIISEWVNIIKTPYILECIMDNDLRHKYSRIYNERIENSNTEK
jgi:hypothetical protein